MAKACNICKSGKFVTRAFKYNGLDVMRCRACGLYFVDEAISPSELSGLYKEDMYANYWKYGSGFYEKHWKEMENHSEDIIDDLKKEARHLESYCKGGKILDIGCFKGDFCAIMKEKGWEAVGIDISEEAIASGRKRGLELYCGELQGVKLDNGSFDVVTLWGVLEHLRDPRHVMKQVYPLLKQGGMLVIKTQNQASILSLIASILYKLSFGRIASHLEFFYSREHLYRFSPGNLGRLLGEEGLTPVNIRYESAYIVKFALKNSKLYLMIPIKIIEHISRVFNKQDKFVMYAVKR